jgi:PAS domain S-box-containing protein
LAHAYLVHEWFDASIASFERILDDSGTMQSSIPTPLPHPVRQPLVIDSTQSVQSALSAMVADRHPAVLAVTGHQLVGILVAQDLLKLCSTGQNLSTVTIADVMTQPVISCTQTDWLQPDGSLIALNQMAQHQISHLPILDESQQIVGIVRSADLYQAQLRHSEALYGSVITVMQEGVVLQDTSGNIIACNRSAENILGLSHEQMMGRSSLDPTWQTIHADGSPFPGDTHPAIMTLQTGLPYSEVIMGVHQPGGAIRWISINSQPLFRIERAIDGVVTSFTDITARQAAEAKLQQLNEELEMRVADRTLTLRENQQFLQLALTGARAGTWNWNIQTNEIAWSPETYNLHGVDPAHGPIQHADWVNLVHPEDRHKASAIRQRCFAEHDAEFRCEFRIMHPQHGLRWLLGLGRILFDEQNQPRHMSGITLDITEQRVVEQMKQEFIAVVSHELRTPLTSIRGSLGLLGAGLLDDNPVLRQRMLTVAQLEVERLTRLVNDILDLERLESHQARFDRAWCDAAELVQTVSHSLQSVAAETQIALVWEMPVNLKIWVDTDRIAQVLINLLNNAIKFSPEHTTITTIAAITEGGVTFRVRDQGRGIPAHQLETVFDRFKQLDASDSRTKGGTGLGLAICRGIVEQHGGKIWVESVVGAGSTFCFTLPMPRI